VDDRLALGLAVLAAYLAAGTAAALAVRRRGYRFEDYAVAGRRLGGLLSAMTYAATTYSSFMIVGLVGFSFSTGIGAYGFELVYFVATLGLLAVFAPRVWRLSRERGWLTPGQMLADLAGSPRLAPALAALYLVALVPYASVQLKGVGEAVAGLAGQEYYVAGVLLGAAVMAAWSALAGVWSVAITDAIQGAWMLASALALLAWLALALQSQGLGPIEAWRALEEAGLARLGGFWTLPVFLAFTLPWAFFAVTNPQVVQRLYMPRDERSLARMIVLFGLFGLIYTIIVTMIGFLARAGAETGALPLAPDTPRDQVTPTLLALTHPLLSAAVFTSIVAASVSTADSILVTLATEAAADTAGSEKGRRRAYYAALIAFTAAMAAVAIARVGYIVALSVLSSVILLGLAPPTIALWLGARPVPASVWASMLTGPLAVAAATAYYGSPIKAFTATIAGAPLSAWILVAATLLTLAGALAWKRESGSQSA